MRRALVVVAKQYNCLPEEMAERLRARGNSWEEFMELLAHFRLEDRERKAKDKKPDGAPLQIPAGLKKKGEPKTPRKR